MTSIKDWGLKKEEEEKKRGGCIHVTYRKLTTAVETHVFEEELNSTSGRHIDVIVVAAH